MALRVCRANNLFIYANTFLTFFLPSYTTIFDAANSESLAALIQDSNNGGFDYVIHAGE